MVISLGFLNKFAAIPKWAYAVFAALVLAALFLAGLQAQAHAQDKKWDTASAAFAKADYETVNRQLKGVGVPEAADRLRVYAQTKLAMRDLDAALIGYQKLNAVNADPSYQLIIGNIYNEQKKYDEAAKVYQQAIASNPQNVQAYVNLATLYKLQGDTKQARSVAAQAVSANPSNATLLELRISMLMDDKANADYKDAVAQLKRVNPADPLLAALK